MCVDHLNGYLNLLLLRNTFLLLQEIQYFWNSNIILGEVSCAYGTYCYLRFLKQNQNAVQVKFSLLPMIVCGKLWTKINDKVWPAYVAFQGNIIKRTR